MTRKELIRIGTLMGLSYNKEYMFPSDIKKGIVVFDGCNGQRFVIGSRWPIKDIYERLGGALIAFGKRQKCVEISMTLSINSD